MSNNHVEHNDLLNSFIKKHLKENFRPLDSLPENFRFAVDHAITMKACFLIKNSFYSSRHKEIIIPDESPDHSVLKTNEYNFGSLEIKRILDNHRDHDYLVLSFDSNELKIVRRCYNHFWRNTDLTFNTDNYNLFEFLKLHNRISYRTPAHLFRHFGFPINPRIGEFAIKYCRMCQEVFPEILRNEESSNFEEESFFNFLSILKRWMFPHTTMEMVDFKIDSFMHVIGNIKKMENENKWPFRSVILFKDENGFIEQVLMRFILVDSATSTVISHCHIPFTFWRLQGSDKRFIFPLPRPKSQILFNLDKLHSHRDHVVILTSSVELAALNTRHTNSRITWTSWLGGLDGMPDVDWTPLRERTVFVAVHSRAPDTLHEAYLEASRIHERLSKLKLEINVGFVELVVDYPFDPVAAEFSSMEGYYSHAMVRDIDHKLRSATVMTCEEFEARLIEVDEFLEKREVANRPFDYCQTIEDVADDAGAELDPDDSRKGWVRCLLIPLIEYGKMTCVYAEEGCGKTVTVTTICGAMISGKPLFEGGHWCVPEEFQGKICCLYLSFEGEADFIETVNDFFNPAASPENRDEYLSRFKCITNFDADREKCDNPKEIVISKVKDFQKEMTKIDNPVLVVVIDNYLSMLDTKDSVDGWKNVLSPLVKFFRSNEITSILIDHTNNENKLEGMAEKKRFLSKIVKITSTAKKNINLRERPVKIHLDKFRNNKIDGIGNDVEMIYDGKRKKWVLYDTSSKQPFGKNELEMYEVKNMLELYIYYHKGKKFQAKETAPLLGISYVAYRNKIKGYIESRNELVEKFNAATESGFKLIDKVDFELYQTVDKLIREASTADAKSLKGEFKPL